MQITNVSSAFNLAQHAWIQLTVHHVCRICGFTKQHALQFALVLTITAQTEDVSHVNPPAMIVTHSPVVELV